MNTNSTTKTTPKLKKENQAKPIVDACYEDSIESAIPENKSDHTPLFTENPSLGKMIRKNNFAIAGLVSW